MSRSSVFRSFAGRFASGFLVLALALALAPLVSGQPAIAETPPAGMQKGVPAITLSSGNNTTTISFAGQDWWAIGYDGQGIYSTAGNGRVTLFLKTPGNPYGNTAFDQSGQSYDYGGSTLQEAMNTIYRSFPTKEQSLVSARNLDDIAGEAVTGQSL